MNSPGCGPFPQWITTAAPACAIIGHTPSSSGSSAVNAPTWMCTLNTVTPDRRAWATVSSTPGSGKNVAEGTASSWAAAKVAEYAFSQSAMPGRCA